ARHRRGPQARAALLREGRGEQPPDAGGRGRGPDVAALRPQREEAGHVRRPQGRRASPPHPRRERPAPGAVPLSRSDPTPDPGPNPGALPRNVKVLGLASLLNDVASEMIYPLMPRFLLATLGGDRFQLGAIEGVADSLASLLKLGSGW